jgi:adenylate cyclase
MKDRRKRRKLFETRYFGLLIGLGVLSLVFLFSTFTRIPANLKIKMVDVFFALKSTEIGRSRNLQVGVTADAGNPKISKDILIVGIDSVSLNRFGRWPFPRYRHANLLDSLTRIQDQSQRERAVFLDIMFNEPEVDATNDAVLLRSIRDNERVFLETTMTVASAGAETEAEYLARYEVLAERYGEITRVQGPWTKLEPYFGMETPLKPYAGAINGFGHADFVEDFDGTYRYLPVIQRFSVFVEEVPLDTLSPDSANGSYAFESLMWIDTENRPHFVSLPLTQNDIERLRAQMERKAPQKAVDTDNDGKPDRFFHVLRRYRDRFIPSMSLVLALEYFNKTLDEIEVVVGKYIHIPGPKKYDTVTDSWVPYSIIERAAEFDENQMLVKEAKIREVRDIYIPIDERGRMLINYMGRSSDSLREGTQTYPTRPYYGYASAIPSPDPATWPRTKALGNKLVLVGAYARGIATDEKPTPFGLMYGVEIHANALNTIIMDNFLVPVPGWVDALILTVLVMITAFMSSRRSAVVSMIMVLIVLVVFLFTSALVFDYLSVILDFSSTAIAVVLTFLSVVVYRAMTEEKDKKRIRQMFGKYVSPTVVDQILENPPELGGVDKELTVLFSDIRGFTTLSENMTPQELVNHLNEYLTAMTDVIMEYQGTLDKYVGDEIMCFWGAPLPQPDHAYLACACALKQMAVLRELNESWPPEKRINIGIGVNSGIMTVGNMGSLGRMNYTLTGDNVNLGARLEGTNKEYGTNIIISEYTYGLVKDRVVARELDNIRVKGKNRPVLIYELVDVIGELKPPVVEHRKGKRGVPEATSPNADPRKAGPRGAPAVHA